MLQAVYHTRSIKVIKNVLGPQLWTYTKNPDISITEEYFRKELEFTANLYVYCFEGRTSQMSSVQHKYDQGHLYAMYQILCAIR